MRAGPLSVVTSTRTLLTAQIDQTSAQALLDVRTWRSDPKAIAKYCPPMKCTTWLRCTDHCLATSLLTAYVERVKQTLQAATEPAEADRELWSRLGHRFVGSVCPSTQSRPIELDVAQGCLLSPFLYNFFLNSLLEEFGAPGIRQAGGRTQPCGTIVCRR